MSIFIRRFRSWWQPPRRAGNRIEHRQVSFLELFYDLVYVALIAELSHSLSSHIGWTALGSFAFLFVIVWWAWLNGSIYHDIHGNNDIRTRVFTFLQMITVVAMAVFAHDALGKSSVGFAISCAAFQLILSWLWWRTGVYDAAHRPLSIPYVVAYLLSMLLFFGSIFVAAPVRFYLWGVALLLSLLAPLFMRLRNDSPEVQAQIDLSMNISDSLVERFGLFTIIVLGEVIIGIVSGVNEHHGLNWQVGVTAILSMLIAIGLWWVYFDLISHHRPLRNMSTVFIWLYLHLFLTLGITAVGASVLNVVKHAGDPLPTEVRWLLLAATAMTLITTAFLTQTTQILPEHQRVHDIGRRGLFISAILIIALGFIPLNTIPLLSAIALLLLLPVFFGLRVWVEIIGTDDEMDAALDVE
jgi:low temperature requirement protein LtrA